jgi:hypothetical protein
MKPILFNTEMVRALLEGRKTVTRRVVKPQPKGAHDVIDYDDEEHTADLLCGNNGEGNAFLDWAETVKAPFWTGDILYVRETFRIDYLSNIPGAGRVQYKDGTYMDIRFTPERYDMMRQAQRKPGWRPNENMPREAARIFLRVTDVRVERLQEIDGLEAFDEGAVAPMPKGCLPPQKPDGYDDWSERKKNDWLHSMARATYISKLEFQERLIKAFRNIWDSTIKPKDLAAYGWDANPFVWVIEFERITKEEAEKE